MCGFTAYVGADARARRDEAQRLAERLRHRGPDDAGSFASNAATLAHQRLSIIDVAGGRQPIASEDGRVVVACNGEIYNQRELRERLSARHTFRTRSDSEVIVHLYEDHGDAFVRELDGMFAFVLTDGERFLAARDPLGIKPLYVGREGDGLWFASELKAIPRTCSDVFELPPGCQMTREGVSRWFTPPWTDPPRAPKAPDPAGLLAVLERAVEKRLMSDVPLGVFLSGGLDSSIIAALVRRRVPHLHSFAVGFEGSPDLEAARRVADHIGTTHHEYVYSAAEAADALERVIEHLESYDAALIESAVPCYFVSKLTAEHVKVVLTGEGADEVFAGYGYMARITEPGALHRECGRLLAGLHNMNLQRVDRMTMAHALEGRVPFLDVDLITWGMAQDPANKLRGAGRPEKWLLRCAAESLLPREIVWRTKQEFADGCGSKTVLREHCERSVTDADFARAKDWFPSDVPQTKEAFSYRRIFDGMFPGEALRKTVGRWRGWLPIQGKEEEAVCRAMRP